MIDITKIDHIGIRVRDKLSAIAFYEGLGYEMVEEKSKDVGEGQRLDFWKARKFLLPIQN